MRKDPCGIFCIILVYIILVYSDYAYLFWVSWNPKSSVLTVINIIIYQIIIFLLFWSHCNASFSDPGRISKPKNNLDFCLDSEFSSNESLLSKDDWTVCAKCEIYRPPEAHHCRICKSCIRKMDHHCPWINNCVGEFNQKYFLQFLFYVCVLCIYTVISILIQFVSHRKTSQQRAIHCIILLIESLLFGIFVIAMFTDQLQAIFNNESTIDRFKSIKKSRLNRPTKSKYALLSEVCGTSHILLWFLPCSLRSSKNYHQYLV